MRFGNNNYVLEKVLKRLYAINFLAVMGWEWGQDLRELGENGDRNFGMGWGWGQINSCGVGIETQSHPLCTLLFAVIDLYSLQTGITLLFIFIYLFIH